ncbi:exopolysaccharide transport family protein [Mariniflexile jejuense]|uniref:Exopolysaccharide transport family protein n=1 Tax=Mariniflexile jejuense TaxID=1173582 RepID=A0ABW3JGI3_9FLAO
MKIIDFIRLILRHLALLILVPFTLATLVLLLTLNPSFEYSSSTMLYTGLATGSSIEMDKTFNYFATNIAFDNLINIINSRETQEEVAVRLLALHLMLPEANPKYISKELYDELRLKIPNDIYNYIEKGTNNNHIINSAEVVYNPLPPEINRNNYEKTVQNLLKLMRSSSDNFIYEIINYEDDKHYSIKALSSITAQRINSSDLIKMSYTVNDPGICQQTLAIYNEICIKNYKNIKENRSDAVVKYFEDQLAQANNSLKEAEDKLLEFNKTHKIINYYEQSKAVAVVKEDMGVDYNNKKAQLAGTEASTKRIEEKLNIQEFIQKETGEILNKKKILGEINYEIAFNEARQDSKTNELVISRIDQLNQKKNNLTNEIKQSVDKIYSYQNSIDGVPLSKLLPDWMNNVVESENLKAKIEVMDEQNKKFEDQYATYAPAGSTIKRIEREISVSEQGYLELLHGLNLAKLKLQDNELSANLKTIDPPFYPLSPNPTKRSILIIAAAFIGGILTLGIILVMEYFDDTLKNSIKASKKTGFEALGMIPKVILDSGNIDLRFIQKRLIEIVTQNILQFVGITNTEKIPKTIIFFSTQKMEGKTVLAGNIAKTLKEEGKKVVLLNYDEKQKELKQQRKFPFINKILGYPDPRIDIDNSFLKDVSSYLDELEYFSYTTNSKFFDAKNYTDILEQNNITLDFKPDFVLIEMPAIIFNNYPAELFVNADLNILVSRSNRVWSDADETAISNLRKTCGSKINILVNGVNINEVEFVLGDLPKKRSKLRKKIKEMFKFQFFSKNQI